MFRKFGRALGATVVVGAAVLATAGSAHADGGLITHYDFYVYNSNGQLAGHAWADVEWFNTYAALTDIGIKDNLKDGRGVRFVGSSNVEGKILGVNNSGAGTIVRDSYDYIDTGSGSSKLTFELCSATNTTTYACQERTVG